MQNNAISHKLLALRRSLDLTQAEFAQATGFSLRAISAWETGERIPKNRNMEEIERFVSKALADTTKGEGVEPATDITNAEKKEDEMYRLKYEALFESYIEQQRLIISLQQDLLSLKGREVKKPQPLGKKKAL